MRPIIMWNELWDIIYLRVVEIAFQASVREPYFGYTTHLVQFPSIQAVCTHCSLHFPSRLDTSTFHLFPS
jgi:hypothetical protein